MKTAKEILLEYHRWTLNQDDYDVLPDSRIDEFLATQAKGGSGEVEPCPYCINGLEDLGNGNIVDCDFCRGSGTILSTPPVTPQDDMKCQCGEESTGNTTICCCNVCGLPLPTEPWHFNLPTPSTHSEEWDIEKAWRTYSDTFSNADTSGWQDLMDKESFFEAAKSLTPTKPVEITEEEIIHFMRIGLEYLEDADGSGRFFGEREVAKAILTKLNGER